MLNHITKIIFTTITLNLNTFFQELHIKDQRWVWDLAFSADSQYLLTASSDNVARLWNLPNSEVKREYIGHQKSLTCLAFRDGQSA